MARGGQGPGMGTEMPSPRSSAARATDREVRVVAAVLVAGSEKAAAHRLGLSHSTVKHHLANARSKVGAATTAQLVCILAPRLPEATHYPLSYRRAGLDDTAERRQTFGFWFDALPGATTTLRVVVTALGERKTRADLSRRRHRPRPRSGSPLPCMFDSRQDGRPVSRQRSKWIDSTICWISAFTASSGTSPSRSPVGREPIIRRTPSTSRIQTSPQS